MRGARGQSLPRTLRQDPGCGLAQACRSREHEPLKHVRLLLADDHHDCLAVASSLLEPEFEVVGTARDGQTLLDEAARLQPDMLVLDISMPVLNGIEAARRLKAARLQREDFFLTVHEDPDYLRAALAAGADGYVVKSRLARDLLLALREALAGRTFVSPLITLAD